MQMSLQDFEEAVDEAIDAIPDELAREMAAMANVAVVIEDEYVPRPGDEPGVELLGLYEGVPLTERGAWWDAGSLPDRISIFRGPILRCCGSREEVVHEIKVTVIHEVAHYFGIDDHRLHELGWD
ncbi:metallopeptidase family protein [Arthrobacter sp. I2-34]|uniref:Metallopeptidase family protein n=1 Tax=Arthrobacter hankyongi TaxID=2904801 RepID=A0ABS9LDK9_9MICC|nr:metallopeptidase family protein [Arthrobacter hankyongi]MCG2624603.1 metallopeptidase family protein [Arthrobacter hankyongi]